MITEDQTATIEFLGAPATHGGESVERIDTHTSIVFLTGRRAWKLKRALARHGAHLDRRRESGFVRECHGDLHLRNIVLSDGRPTLFDAIEFNDEIACIDVLWQRAMRTIRLHLASTRLVADVRST